MMGKYWSPKIKSKTDKGNPRRKWTGTVEKNSSGSSSSPNYLRASTEHYSPVKTRNTRKIQKYIGSEVPSENNTNSTVQPVLNLSQLPKSVGVIETELPVLSKKYKVLIRHPSDAKIMKNENVSSSPKSSPGPEGKSVMGSPFSSPTASLGTNDTRSTATQSGDITGTSKTAVRRTATLSVEPSRGRVVGPNWRKFSGLQLAYHTKDQYRKGKTESKKLINNKVHVKPLHVEPPTEDEVLEHVQSDGNIETSPSTSPLSQSPMELTHDKDQPQILDVDDETNENKMLEDVQTDGSKQNSPSHPDSEVLSPYIEEAGESEYIDVENADQFEDTDGSVVEVSEYTQSDESEFVESETDEFEFSPDIEVDTLTGNHHRSLRKGKKFNSEDTDSAMTKAKFRRGRIIDPESYNDVPRKLKFRRGRVVENDDGSKTYIVRRKFKKREVVENSNATSPDSEKVVLRHQETQAKKNEQGLFNNVIEQTATKLAGSRNSKVKALVGAFETVISLQDENTSPQHEES